MQIVERARQFVAQIELCKREVHGLIALWRALRDHCSIRDELAMAKMTLQLVPLGEPIPEHQQIFKVLRALAQKS